MEGKAREKRSFGVVEAAVGREEPDRLGVKDAVGFRVDAVRD